MTSDKPLVSIVCPAYDEEQVLPLFHAALCEALESLDDDCSVEVIYVDDGSRDRTPDVLREIAEFDSRVQLLSLTRNFGHQAALTAGLEHARGAAIVTLDVDLQHPPQLIPTLVAHWRRGADVVQTIRADDPKISWLKRQSSSCFYRLLRRWSDLDVRPAAADFRLLSRRVLDGLLSLRESHRYLRGMVQWLGFRVTEVPYRPGPRRAGVSKFTFAKMLRLGLDGLCSFSRAPLRLPIAFGIAAIALSLILSLLWVTSRSGDALLAAAIGAIHFMAFALFAAIGILGEYLGRVYDECKRRPVYVLKDAFPNSILESLKPPIGSHPSERSAA